MQSPRCGFTLRAMIDLRSDTVTKPTPEMRRAMAEAEVGDDVFGDDPTIKELERATAELLGKEAAVFVPSGTLAKLSAVAREHGLAVHMDGARLWNATAATGTPERAFASHCDTVSVCYSKGLGAPVGSALVGPAPLIQTARRFRKMYGGGMRQ